jgi:oligopeptide/dipeptide ABC transporter ATP-binding protein
VLLELRELCVDLAVADGKRPLLRSVSFDIAAGESVGLVGESGSGKSMTARAISRLLPNRAEASGSVRFGEIDVLALTGKELRDYRRRQISMVFQDPRAHVNPVRTIRDFLTESMRDDGLSRSAATARARQLLDDVGLPSDRGILGRFPHELSGGMLQRVMIAAALAGQPRLILADEPTTALDVTIQEEVMSILDRLRRDHGVAMLFITHDLELAAATCDRTVVMYAGSVVEEQRSEDLHRAPLHPYTRALLDSRPSLDRAVRRLIAIPGSPIAPYEVQTGCAFSPRCPYSDQQCIDVEPELRRVEEGLVACHYAESLELRPRLDTATR